MTPAEGHRKRIEEVLAKRSDLIEGDDGYFVYWPTIDWGRGFMTAHDLRVIADILDEKNAAWDAHVQRECGPPP